GVAVDPNRHLFRIASVSKTFTWILLMREVEAGRIRLDRPVNEYLPADLRIPDQGFKRPIRVLDLMAHAGGFEDTALGHLFTDDPAKVTTLREYLKRYRPNRVREAGVLSTYCNWCVALAGEMVAVTSKTKDFQTLADRDVFGPLGMTSTTFRQPYPAKAGLPAPMPKALADRMSAGFRWTGSGYAETKFEFGSMDPAGSVSTTAPDMARYMIALLADGRIDEGRSLFGPLSAKAFRTPIMKVGPGVNGWAHGFMAQTAPGGFRGYGHGGALSNYFTGMMVYPELDLGVFVSVNSDTGRAITERLPAHIIARFYAPANETLLPPDAKLKDRAARYAGYYLGTRRSYTGLEGFGYRFFSGGDVSVDPAGYLVVATGSGARQYVPDGRPDGFVSTDGRSRLTFAAKGDTAVSFAASSGTQTFERAGPLEKPDNLLMLVALTALAAAAGIIGAFTRIGRDIRPTRAQSLSNLGYLAASVLWLAGFGLIAAWAAGAESNEMLYTWPQPAILAGSALLLLATIASILLLLHLPLAWKGSRHGEGWTIWRKLRQTIGVLVFAAAAYMAFHWGAIQFWST
ncbi:MAG TPA: serine hydrolase domain-containing protein, partial [Caulobacter sp.]|nr:serine hydrolase domain-containing protein [Caulobacter sp.]